MKLTLAENIRKYRKERALTQEQLAEVLGLTAGAVYKWEAGLSVPDLELIVQMADFFDTSVDVLLGYEIKDNSHDATVRRLREYRRNKDWEGLAEAEKALKKYPHSFQIVRQSAAIYNAFGYESGDRELLRRALELLERSRLLLDQNTDPEISEQTIYGAIAQTYWGLGEADKAVEIWKEHNSDMIFSHRIGHILAQDCNRTEEAAPYLSEALARIVSDLFVTVIGYVNMFAKRRDFASAEAILTWGVTVFSGLRKGNKPNYLDRLSSVFLVARAQVQFEAGDENAARESLIKAKALAEFFDADPSYDESDIRFIDRIEGASAHDDMGATAMEAVQGVVREYDKEAFTALWERVKQHSTDCGEVCADAQPTV